MVGGVNSKKGGTKHMGQKLILLSLHLLETQVVISLTKKIETFHTTLDVLLFLFPKVSHSIFFNYFVPPETFQSLPIVWKPKRRQGEGVFGGKVASQIGMS